MESFDIRENNKYWGCMVGGGIGVGKQKRFCTFASKNLKSNNLVMIYLLLMV